MNGALLDSFQYVVGAYVLYVAIKGRGRLYTFEKVRAADRETVRKILRGIYFAIASLCTLDAAASGLLNRLFSVRYLEDGSKVVTRLSQLSWWPDIPYAVLFHGISILVALIVAALIAALVVVKKHSD